MPVRTAIIDYGSGNLRSVAKALQHVAPAGADVAVVTEAAALAEAERIVLPGVGAFADCMRGLSAVPGLIAALERAVLRDRKPFLGICVGMQLMLERGHEHGVSAGLGWIPGEVVPLTPADPSLKVPHMGWNDWRAVTPHPLFSGLADDAQLYFVHSYHAVCSQAADVLATTDYGGPVVAAIARGNLAGVQFHPEKSQAAGLQILRNFLSWQPDHLTREGAI